MDWNRHKSDWPHADASRFTVIDRQAWHVQQHAGPNEGAPTVLLLHGSGATTHSWAEMIEPLTEHFAVIAIDLPGHGFTQPMPDNRPTLPKVAAAVARLMAQEGITPDLIIGHSAGAAIAVQMLDHLPKPPAGIISLNGAFYPFPGFAAQLFPAAAKLLFLNPFVPWAFSFGAGSTSRVEQLLKSTGSKISPEGLRRYQAALMSRAHVEGALALMANWDLTQMEARLRRLAVPFLVVVGENDGTVDPQSGRRTAGLVPGATLVEISETGHLAHEEEPALTVRTIVDFARQDCSPPLL